MQVMLLVSMLLYIITAMMMIFISYEFMLAHNGINAELKRALIWFFAGLGLNLMIRGIWGLLDLATRVVLNPYISFLVIVITLAVTLRFFIVINRYRK